MNPVQFPRANQNAGGRDEHGKEYGILPVYNDGRIVVSCWEMTEEEFAEFAKTRRIYIELHTGGHIPPQLATIENPVPVFKTKGYLCYYRRDPILYGQNGSPLPFGKYLYILADAPAPMGFKFENSNYVLVPEKSRNVGQKGIVPGDLFVIELTDDIRATYDLPEDAVWWIFQHHANGTDTAAQAVVYNAKYDKDGKSE